MTAIDAHRPATTELHQLAQTAVAFLRRHWTAEVLTHLDHGDLGPADEVTRAAAELGWLGLTVPAEHDGAGAGLVEAAVLLEVAGRFLFVEPLLSTVVSAALLGASRDQPITADVMSSLARGEVRVTPVLTSATVAARGGAGLRVTHTGADRCRLDGSDAAVSMSGSGDLLLVPTPARGDGSSDGVFLVEARSSGIRIHDVDAERTVPRAVTFDGLQLGPHLRIVPGARAPAVVDDTLSVAAVCLSALGAGVAARVLELTLAHLEVREQFGRTLSRFQAVQMRCADMAVTLDGMRSITRRAADAVERDVGDAARLASAARAWSIRGLLDITRNAHVLHGAIGFTEEYPLHRYSRWAHMTRGLFGDASFHRQRFVEHHVRP